MEQFAILCVLSLFALIIAGSVCGIVGLIRLRRLKGDLKRFEIELMRLRRDLRQGAQVAPVQPPVYKEKSETTVPPPPPPDSTPSKPSQPSVRQGVATPCLTRTITGPPEKPVGAQSMEAPPDAASEYVPSWYKEIEKKSFIPSSLPSLEILLGTKVISWVGIVMSLVATAIFLKYAVDNDWIGPRGRLAIGVVAGIVSLCFGERFRRRDWAVLFQTLTGGGIAIFYICLFFSFQIYELTAAPLSMGLAVWVTLFAVAMAVGHNAVSIALVGLIGGFLSPVLLSTGDNHPYALFAYIAILDLVAVGAAYFRKWRALDIFCFAATAILYQAWYTKYYDSTQLTPALCYMWLFYVMFLLIPSLYNLTRRLTEDIDSLSLIVANSAYSLYCFYNVLFDSHRQLLGFFVIGQSLLVFLLFRLWTARTQGSTNSARSLLIISLALVALAVPIQLKLYGIPIAWAFEGAVFTYLGLRFRQIITRVAGAAALLLSAGGLLAQLPLHHKAFLPVFNVSFGSWLLVIGLALVMGYLLYRRYGDFAGDRKILGAVSFAIAAVLGCALLSLEISDYWRFSANPDYQTHRMSSLIVLWALIGLATASVLQKMNLRRAVSDVQPPDWMPVSWGVSGIGVVLFLVGLVQYDIPSEWLIFNSTYLPKLFFIILLWWLASRFRRKQDASPAYELSYGFTGHALFALLSAFELYRWSDHSSLLTDRLGFALISGAWALQALALVWFGLIMRNQARRLAGLLLFALSVGKVCLVDTWELDMIYKMVSWLAGGLLLLGAAYFYQRYRAVIEHEEGKEKEA